MVSSMGARMRSILPGLLTSAGVLLLLVQSSWAATTIRGSVYCDQCLDGHRSVWSIPLDGAKVAVECNDSKGQKVLSREGETGLFGDYAIRFDWSPNLGGCVVRVLSSPKRTCNIAATGSKSISLSWKLFGLSFYSVDALSFRPSKAMSFCPNSSGKSPGTSFPILPFEKLSACPYNDWLDPQFKCYWRLLSPDTKVSVFYGETAGKKYGSDITLWQGLHGSGDINKVLLREAITASLNAFNSIHFYYSPVSVHVHFNQAIKGTDKDVVRWALAFKRANSGYGGKAKCLMTKCK
eukprot:c13485_g1_i1 orf=395-1276(-)